MHFTVSGVETSIFIPPLIAFVISFFSSMAGITGAFLILPFQ
ncbi:MAG: sulfite exporter TauE/SafE family protein, partial [Desulfobulbaceae bacterium]|nr:sulfite exporter TauE/SafE family protein [Desulfobulbaceae bacterium]